MSTERVRCLIIGSGPAGYTAAIYTGRANIAPVLYEGIQPGGQLTITTEVENFPGYPEGVSGTQLMEDIRKQAERFGADIRSGIAVAADLSKVYVYLFIDDGKIIEADTVIISTGATAKYLGLDDEKKYAGMGVSACATCDGFFYRKKVVAVVGGGDTGLRRSNLFIRTCIKSLPDCPQTILACFENHAGTCLEQSENRSIVRTQHSGSFWRKWRRRCPCGIQDGHSGRETLRYSHRRFLPRYRTQAQL